MMSMTWSRKFSSPHSLSAEGFAVNRPGHLAYRHRPQQMPHPSPKSSLAMANPSPRLASPAPLSHPPTPKRCAMTRLLMCGSRSKNLIRATASDRAALFRDRSVTEMASLLKLKQNAVEVRLHRARQR